MRSLLVRAAVAFALLCAVKVVLIAGQGEPLHEEHWRIPIYRGSWFGTINFCLFVGLLFSSSVALARRMSPLESGCLRALNGGLLAVGLCFVFLSFEAVGSNYLNTVLHGVLGWRDIGSYLACELFFNPPFLSLYLLVYALGYWILARTKRETWTLPMGGALAAIYFLLNLRNLAIRGQELVLLNCIGVASLAGLAGSRRPLRWYWQLGPVLLLFGVVYALFTGRNPALQNPQPNLVLLLSGTLAAVGLTNVLAHRTSSYPALSHLAPFLSLSFLILSSHDYPLAANYNHLMIYALTLPHYVWQEFLCAMTLFAIGLIIVRWLPKASLWLVDTLAALLILAAVVDYLLLLRMGIRLDWTALISNTDPIFLWRTIGPFIGSL